MQVGDVLRKKTARVATVRMNETVAIAAQLMRSSNISALVVKDVVRTEGNTAVGMFTERRVAFGADDILDDQRADIAGTHQLRGNGDGLVHANRCDTGGFLAQDISDFHGNLLG